jgi:hypothetical protein
MKSFPALCQPLENLLFLNIERRLFQPTLPLVLKLLCLGNTLLLEKLLPGCTRFLGLSGCGMPEQFQSQGQQEG